MCADDKENADDKTTELKALIKADLMGLKRSEFQFDDSLLDIYTGILLSKISFNDEAGYTESRSAYLNELNIEGIPMQYHQFSLVDFNQDQVPELVLKATRGEGAEMVLVFHIQEGEAYYINGEKVGEEAFSSYMKDYENKEDAAWCEFPDEIQNNN